MAQSGKKEVSLRDAAACLFDYGVDRGDLGLILEGLPDDDTINRVAAEYELRILRIVSVGWSISYFMAAGDSRQALAEGYWQSVAAFSGQVSEMSSTTSGTEVDYFSVIRERADGYLSALNHYQDAGDPAIVIGPTLAKMCGDEENPYLIISAKKLFHITLSGVKNYLESIELP